MGKNQKSDEDVPDYLQNIFRRHFQVYSLKSPKKMTLVYDSSKEIERSEIIIKQTVVPIWVNPGDQDETKKFQKNVVFNLNLLTPDNFEKIRVILLDLIKKNKVICFKFKLKKNQYNFPKKLTVLFKKKKKKTGSPK